jgi:hypothetical protein
VAWPLTWPLTSNSGPHPVILLHFRQRGEDELVERQPGSDAAPGLSTREHQHVLVVPPQARGQVIHAEQRGKPRRITLFTLHLLQQAKLLFHQQLAAPSQIDDNRVHAVAMLVNHGASRAVLLPVTN